jgi:hypothetical protein
VFAERGGSFSGGGKASVLEEGGGEEGFEEEVPIFNVIDGRCGEEKAVFAAGGLLDTEWNIILTVGKVARWASGIDVGTRWRQSCGWGRIKWR